MIKAAGESGEESSAAEESKIERNQKMATKDGGADGDEESDDWEDIDCDDGEMEDVEEVDSEEEESSE